MKKILLLMLILLSISTLCSCKDDEASENGSEEPNYIVSFEKPTKKLTTQEEIKEWWDDYYSKSSQQIKEIPSFTLYDKRVVYNEEIINNYDNSQDSFNINTITRNEINHVNINEKYCQFEGSQTNDIFLYSDGTVYALNPQTKTYNSTNFTESFISTNQRYFMGFIHHCCQNYLMTGFENPGYNTIYTIEFYSDKPGQMYVEIYRYDKVIGSSLNTFVNKITAYFENYVGLMYQEETIYLKTNETVSSIYMSLTIPTTLKKPNINEYTLAPAEE